VFAIEMAGLRAVFAQLDAAFDRAVEAIVQALGSRGKIVIVGIGVLAAAGKSCYPFRNAN
jgi:hypothetical protein